MKKFFVCLFIISFIVSLTGVAFASIFYDVKGTVYEGTVNRIARLGIINGISETAYAPNKSLTRGELAKIIVFTKGLDKYAKEYGTSYRFKDVKDHWAEKYINVAADLGILNGYEDGTFRPDAEVSNAELIVMALRSLGYLELKPQENGTWYSGYTKRMYELELNKGMANLKSYDAAAKRGDFAMLWWNMLVSEKWAVSSQNEKSGLIYTYSDRTQLQELFPDYNLVKGKITRISGNSSGDIVVTINGIDYITDSYVPIYTYGAVAVGVSDKQQEEGTYILYGLSIDDDYADLEIVEGPIFYLEDCGYNLSKAKSTSTYGTKSKATYAYLVASANEKDIYRAVLVDASNSMIVDSVSIEYDEKKENATEKTGTIFINEEEIADLNSIIIKNGKQVEWKDLKKDVILTELIPGALYTYSDKSFEGVITDYSDLSNLYVNNDKYIVSSDCIYTVDDDEEEDGKLEEYSYDDKMTKSKLKEYMLRDATFYLNVAEEIAKITFDEYKAENITEKYENNEYRFLYVTSIAYISGDGSKCRITGYSPFNSKKVSYTVESNDELNGIGDLVVLHEINGKNASELYLIESSKEFGDYTVVYDNEYAYKNNAFGEYLISGTCKIYKIEKTYETNTLNNVEKCEVNEIHSIDALGNLENYKINFIADKEMNVEVIYAEKEINKVTYPIARITSVTKHKGDSNSSDNKNSVAKVDVKANILGFGTRTCVLNIGDCEEGELVLLDATDEFKETTIEERFRLELIGYEKDFVVEKYDKKLKTAFVRDCKDLLDMRGAEFKTESKTYYLDNYTFVLSTVTYDEKADKWKFASGKIYEKEDLTLQAGDRIAFGELSNVAVVYRGYRNGGQ